MVSEEDFLRKIAELFGKCPICDANEGFKIVGFFGKKLECNSCKARWSGYTDKNGVHWLKLEKPSNAPLVDRGEYIIDKAFPLEFWLDTEKPFLDYDQYAKRIIFSFKDLENTPAAPGFIGRAFFRGSATLLMGPSCDFVAEIFPAREGKKVIVKIIDLTAEFKEKKHHENDWFYFLVSKRIHKNLRGLPIIPYMKVGKDVVKVQENRFYPFKKRLASIPRETLQYATRYGYQHVLQGLFFDGDLATREPLEEAKQGTSIDK